MMTAAGTPHVEKQAAPPTIVLVSQTFPPDPAAVGQHMADLAESLARRGHRVKVLTADRGYDDASIRYPRHQVTSAGVEVERIGHASFGKATLIHRVAALLSFNVQAGLRALFQRDLGAIVFSTSPPFIGLTAVTASAMRNVPAIFWAMDLNPDQLVALGKLKTDGVAARMLRAINRVILRRTSVIIALDEWMAARLRDQAGQPVDILVIPPWSPDAALVPVPHDRNAFRSMHGLHDKKVVMYSGNHTTSNPLTTLLDAAVAVRDCAALEFVFVGGGAGKDEVDEYVKRHNLSNVLTLPYQPKSALSDSLSAADVHVVSLGTSLAGVIHPCKVYGAMAVARPIIYFGPSPSHVSDILSDCDNGWTVPHGDVARAISVLREVAELPRAALDAIGQRGRRAMDSRFDATALCGAVADAVESSMYSGAVG